MSRVVHLSDDELAVLDGQCSEKVQSEVIAALARIQSREAHPSLSVDEAGFLADVVTEARTYGRIVRQNLRARHCKICGKNPGYYRFKSGRRKGEQDWNRPLKFAGVEMARRFVTVQGSITLGGCSECIERLTPEIKTALANVPAQIHASFAAEGRPVYVWNANRHCTACGWTGHEGEMGRQPTLIGYGTYPAECPQCGAKNQVFSQPVVKSSDGFTLTVEQQ